MEKTQKSIGTMLCGALGLASLTSSYVASAQSSPSDYTSAVRYDEKGRQAGSIAPDPDGSGPLKFLASRTSFDSEGRPIKVETGELSTWKSESVAPKDWGGHFSVHTISETSYDTYGRKIKELVRGNNNVITALTQYTYDSSGRIRCVAVRMNPAVYNNLPSSACNQSTAGSFGPDRIERTTYDDQDRVLKIERAIGTNLRQDYVTYTYESSYREPSTVKDANGNLATYTYDRLRRQVGWQFPQKANGAVSAPCNIGTLSQTTLNGELIWGPVSAKGSSDDCEKYSYDQNGNRVRLVKRDGSVINYQYDALNRMTVKDIPYRSDLQSWLRRDVHYTYDLRGLQTSARYWSTGSGGNVTHIYDGFGRVVSESLTHSGTTRTISSQYDKNGNRTHITHPDGYSFQLAFDRLNRATAVKQSTWQLGEISYNNRGLMESLSWSAQAASANRRDYAYDNAGRLNQIGIDLRYSGQDVTWDYTRNPASQIRTESQSNDSYSWDGHVNVTRSYAINGLNQYTSAGSSSFCYDANGNLTADGASVYRYDVENRLVEKRVQTNTNCNSLSYSGGREVLLMYDPLGRLIQVSHGSLGTQLFVNDGNAMIAEYNSSGTVMRRYVHGSNAEADDPLIWYEGSDMSWQGRRFLHADPRGSIVAVTNNVGQSIATNSYDEFGIPDTASGDDIATKGRFRYTGQMWVPELGMYYYKARIYSPTLGRFLQTDPIGYEDQYNLYTYVGNDPINMVDPTGLYRCVGEGDQCAAVDSYVERLGELSNSDELTDEQQTALGAIVGYLGKKGGKGPTIRVDTSIGGKGGVDRAGNIYINTDLINLSGVRYAKTNGINQFDAIKTNGAGTLAQEVVHQAHVRRGPNPFASVRNNIYSEFVGYHMTRAALIAGGIDPGYSVEEGAVASCSNLFSQAACENDYSLLRERGFKRP